MNKDKKENPFDGYFEKMRDYRKGKYIKELSPDDKKMFLNFLRYLLSDEDPKSLDRWMERERSAEVFAAEGMAFALKNGRSHENAKGYKEACASLSLVLSRHGTAGSVRKLIEDLSERG